MGVRSSVSRLAVLGVANTSRLLGLGGGSTIGGHIGLFIDPTLLSSLGANREVALVTGTNGKTTTTRFLTEILGGTSAVATSLAGANMPAGLVTALAHRSKGPYAVLEVDEGYLAQALSELDPAAVVLLNLSRDQLDRVSEVRMVASRWKKALNASDAVIVANADDPLVAWAANDARSVIWVAAGGLWHADSFHCPNCDARIDFGPSSTHDQLPTQPAHGEEVSIEARSLGESIGLDENTWSCSCGFVRPQPYASVRGEEIILADGRHLLLRPRLPGRFNRANAGMAAVAATVFGTKLGSALDAIARVTEVAGRYAVVQVGDVRARLLLAKNPAGFTELIALVRGEQVPLVIGINSKIADGRDPSWLWDVPFDLLKDRTVVATGERCRDLAVRLRHAGISHLTVEDPVSALRSSGAPEVDFIGNYTVFQELRRRLSVRAGLPAKTRYDLTSRTEPRYKATPLPKDLGAWRNSPSRPSTAQSALRVIVVHPDLLGTYGDGGNAIVLANRARWRGIPVELVLSSSDLPLPESGDVYCLGGGEDGPQVRSALLLRRGVLASAVERGAVVLAVCAGYQIIGTSFADADGVAQHGAGLLDAKTIRGEGDRAVGEVKTLPHDATWREAIGVLSGFENHAGVTLLGSGTRPFGEVLSGVGNGPDHMDGAVSGRVFGTYLHGPVLARNPKLADLLLSLIVPSVAKESLDDSEEEDLRNERLGATSRTKSALRKYLPVRMSR